MTEHQSGLGVVAHDFIMPMSYGMQHPIIKTPGPWIVVGSSFSRDPITFEAAPHALDIHFNKDDPLHTFLGPEAWPGWPNARTLSKWHNARHYAAVRLRERRSMHASSDMLAMFQNEEIAADALHLTAEIAEDPDSDHVAGNLYWSPLGTVWDQRNQRRWVVVDAAAVVAAKGIAE